MTIDILKELDIMEDNLSHYMNDRKMKKFREQIEVIRQKAEDDVLHGMPWLEELGEISNDTLRQAVITEYSISSCYAYDSTVEIEIVLTIPA